eukprot:CAMPEP_0177640600 /NCGR_PEP_ID=MMETSP0447-20121125/6628_1 /TAXON_ID=0 /ORGANISM="Stygamoeba regulata, Strain BSH-02190019" /LENGTH=78 /DNA_ID=CAMNT_0019142679 /DNA_START=118 /DNA_END=354 /DNA_ORIENTATION=-
MSATTLFAGAFGWWRGYPQRSRNAWFALYIGLVAGGMVAYQRSTFRLMGLSENDVEVQRNPHRLDTVEPGTVPVHRVK